MGADIHLYVEKRLSNGEWAMVRNLNETIVLTGLSTAPGTDKPRSGYWKLGGRNYRLFARLAAVRGDGPEPKGLPKDVSGYVLEESYGFGSDGHSHSWSTPLEFMEAYIGAREPYDAVDELDEYLQIRIAEGAASALAHFMADMCSLDMGPRDEYRFVYWFDN